MLELVGARSARAVTHARRHEEPIEVARPLDAAHRLGDAFVVRDRVLRRHHRIGPPRIHQQLAAVLLERAEILVDRGHVRQLLLRVGEIAFPVDRAVVPVRIVKQPVLEEADAHRFLRIHDVGAPALSRRVAEPFAAARPAGENLLAGLRVLDAVVGLLRRLDLRGGQAARLVAVLAQQLRRIEMATARIVDDAVLEAVDAVARFDRRPGQQRQLGLRNDRLAVLVVRRDPRVQEGERLPDAVVRRIAGDDAVVVVGIALRFGQRLLAAGGAADEIRLVGEAAAGVADDQLGRLGHHVHRAVAVVDQLFGMALAELHVVAGVPGVGAGGRVAAAQRGRHRGVRDRSLIAAVAHALELAVPRLDRRNPDLELDFGVAARPRRRLDAAERGQGHRCGRALRLTVDERLRAGRRKRPRRHER